MRTGAAAGHDGHFHEAALYDSDDQFLDMVVPFVRDGARAGEPIVITLAPDKTALLRSTLGPIASEVSFLDPGDNYARPSSAIRAYRELLAAHTAAGAEQIRVVGALAPDATALSWAWWARYEAAVNQAYDDFPVWTMCTYDSRAVRGAVLDDVRRTHPNLAGADGRHRVNPAFEDPARFLTGPGGAIDPLEATTPRVDLVDPSLREARRAAREVGRSSRCDETESLDFTHAVNEALTNAQRHGRAPARLRMWSAPHRLVAAISDPGPGPGDPLAGLLAPNGTPSAGMGLWLVHQVCSNVVLGNDQSGFTVRLVVGRPTAPAT